MTERKRIYSSDSEEEESSSGDAMDGEKENEIACNDGGSSATPKRRRTEASQKRSKNAKSLYRVYYVGLYTVQTRSYDIVVSESVYVSVIFSEIS